MDNATRPSTMPSANGATEATDGYCGQMMRTGRRPSAKPGPAVWVLGGLLLGTVGWGVFWAKRGPSHTQPAIPRARIMEAAPALSPGATEAKGPPSKSMCVVPALPEGVGAKDIRSAPDVDLSFVGGTVEKGKYRIVDTFALTSEFTPGRWTFSLDLTENDQGAYYRPVGLTFRSSRIRWSIQGNRLSWETLCPDPGERMSFEFTVIGARLYLLTAEKIVVVLEPYADSEVIRLAPAHDP